jgi:hypothetical protein
VGHNAQRRNPALAIQRTIIAAAAARLVGRSDRLCASSRNSAVSRSGDHPDHEDEGGGQEDHLIEIAQHGDEVGNEIDGAERLSRNRRRCGLHMPRHARIPCGDVEGNDILLNGACPILQSCPDPHSLALFGEKSVSPERI